MTPFELVQWCIAGTCGVIMVGVGISTAIVCIRSALIAGGKKP